MKTYRKKSVIKLAKKPFNYNSKRFKQHMDRMYHKRRSLKEIIFPKHRSFWWKGTSNGVFGPGGRTHWEFKSGNLALVIAIITLLIVIASLWISI